MAAATEDDHFSESEDEGFDLLQNTHRDIVTTSDYNLYGDRFATGSVDGKIKVYNKHKDGSWHLCDTWGAHFAEVTEIKWLPTHLHPHMIASISPDGRFKLWVEDITLPPGKGRRFNSHSNKPVFEMRAPPRAPWTSFSLKHDRETRHTYLALINRNAALRIYENDEPENLENWAELDTINIGEKPPRGEEVSFKVEFDPNTLPCYNAIRQGVPRDALGLIVASMNRASIWRTKDVTQTTTLAASSNTKEFYLACELKGHRGLVRDVAWARGNIRGFDTVATACKDGFIRVFEIHTPTKEDGNGKDTSKTPDQTATSAHRLIENGVRSSPSGIGAGLANARSGNPGARQEAQAREGEVFHVVKEVSRLDTNRSPAWKVDFDHSGQVLGTSGDQGKLFLYRREPSGTWSKNAELALKFSRSYSLPDM